MGNGGGIEHSGRSTLAEHSQALIDSPVATTTAEHCRMETKLGNKTAGRLVAIGRNTMVLRSVRSYRDLTLPPHPTWRILPVAPTDVFQEYVAEIECVQ